MFLNAEKNVYARVPKFSQPPPLTTLCCTSLKLFLVRLGPSNDLIQTVITESVVTTTAFWILEWDPNLELDPSLN